MEFFNRYTPEVTLGPASGAPTATSPSPRSRWCASATCRRAWAWHGTCSGPGRTAVKASLNRYTQDLSLLANSGGSVLSNYQGTASRSWTDDNNNFYPDCNFTTPTAQDLRSSGGDRCGAFTGASANFNLSTATSFNDRDIKFAASTIAGTTGSSRRACSRRLIPRRMAIDVAYFRRWYGNFTITDNFNLNAENYTAFSVVVPTDSRLPLSGQTISGFLDANPDVASRRDRQPRAVHEALRHPEGVLAGR